jgi:hypothetical protein
VCFCILGTNLLLLHCAEPQALHIVHCQGVRQDWRYDLGAGLQVALVSLPLSPGIAVASGAPPITGKNDFVGTKSCGTSQSAAYSIEMSCLN